MRNFLKNRGFAIVWVLLTLAVIATLSFVVINVMRQESTQSFKQLERTIASFACECGIEHAIYIMQFHKNFDCETISTTTGTVNLEINKKFATSDEFEMELPTNSPDDSRLPKLANVDLNDKLEEIAKEYKLEFTPVIDKIKIKYKTLKTVDSSESRFLKYGKCTISCTATYGHTTKTVSSVRRIELYRTMSIEPDWQFVQIDATGATDGPNKCISARRKNGSGYIAQTFLINNGKDASDNPVPAKIYGKELYIYLNNIRPTDFNVLLLVPGAALTEVFLSKIDMMDRLTDSSVDPDIPSDADSTCPLFKYKPYNLPGIEIENLKGFLVEYDFYDTKQKYTWFKNLVSDGGTRGPIDFTGIPEKSGAAEVLDFMKKLIGKTNSDPVLNKICGDVQRRYGYYVKVEDDGGWWDTIVANTVGKLIDFFNDFFNNCDPNEKQSEKYVFGVDANTKPENPEPYDESVYKKLASHGNGKLFTTPDDFAEHKETVGNFLWWDDIDVKTYNNVCTFWGWAETYKDQPKDEWYKFWKWGTRNAFEAARRDPKFAINVNGCYFVDGNVFIEGYYRGRGAIVATGNIIIGGSLLRHPDDGTLDAMSGDLIQEGANNMLQLIALGTRPKEGDKPTGKIIFSPHKYNSKLFATGVATAIFSESTEMKVDANIWAKNGLTVEKDSRDDPSFWEKIWGDQDTFITIYGNVIVKNLCWNEEGSYETWPDKLVINRFQRWVEIVEIMKKMNNVVVNLFPQQDNYKDFLED